MAYSWLDNAQPQAWSGTDQAWVNWGCCNLPSFKKLMVI